MDRSKQHGKATRMPNCGKWMLMGFLLAAAFFLWIEHQAHVLAILPLLLALACPLMHLLHHGRHRNGRPSEAGTRCGIASTAESDDDVRHLFL